MSATRKIPRGHGMYCGDTPSAADRTILVRTSRRPLLFERVDESPLADRAGVGAECFGPL